ncbi:hypothetical protein IFR05_012516 [Cadophora sp. M221]|nr:hypothetical protein IFR05_012516 [Cadophora sp. M221]
MKLTPPKISILGQDPNRKHRINANSFQQNAITTIHGWQYAAFYTAASLSKTGSGCYVNIARRRVCPEVRRELVDEVVEEKWQVLTFGDYEQGLLSRLFANMLVRAGLGSDLLYKYSAATHEYTFLGQHLTGISNSPYINGIDYRQDKLYISWCYRNFITPPSPVAADAHQQQAGPNGPENNFDLNYAFSDDQGVTWKNSQGRVLACMEGGEGVETTILPGAEGVRVFEIPMGSGILNQEGQGADWNGGFWVLNRERVDGEMAWIVYSRDPEGIWMRMIIDGVLRPTETGSRGNVCVDRKGDVYLVLPGNSDASLNIMRARKQEQYSRFEQVWMWDGFDGEPLVDVRRLETSDVLSVFSRTSADVNGIRNVVVLDLLLTEV